MQDYTIDSRGDVGSWFEDFVCFVLSTSHREAALRAFAVLCTHFNQLDSSSDGQAELLASSQFGVVVVC